MSKESAFSLLELFVALSIMSIALMFSFPFLKNFSSRSREKILEVQLLRAIHTARNEANVLGRAIGVCGSKNHLTCSGDWSDGQIVFVDVDQDGVIHDASQIITIFQSHSLQGALHARMFPNRHYLLFLPSVSMHSVNGTFWYCPVSARAPTWAIVLNKSGRTRMLYPDHQGMIKDNDGHPLTCET